MPIRPFTKLSVILALVCLSQALEAQDPTRFQKVVDQYNTESLTYSDDAPILFVGSSSILMWKTVSEDFPNRKIINRGFGGSVMSDLLYYKEDLILRYKPKQIFIYEGDNDISMSKSTAAIIDTTALLISKIRTALPEASIVLISAKPSLQRWHLRKQYLELNQAFADYAAANENVSVANVWKPMLHKNGLVRSDLFIKDGLHMNAVGYGIWKKVMEPLLLP